MLMRELVQLILSIFFGLLPLWIILSRRRNRARRQNASESTPNTTREPVDEDKGYYAPSSNSPLPWENETYARLRAIAAQREESALSIHTPSDTTETETTPETTPEAPTYPQSEEPPEQGGETLSALKREIERGEQQYAQQGAPAKTPPSRTSSQRRARTALLPHTLYRDDLQRAVVLSEILAPPRGVRGWDTPL